MFLVGKLLASPFKGVLWVFKEIHDAARQEKANESAAITAALSELYMKLEAGQITAAEFAAQEKLLLDRLDSLQAKKKRAGPPVKELAARRAPKNPAA